LVALALAGCGAPGKGAAVRSAEAGRFRVERDVVYARRGDVELRADVYVPEGGERFAGVLVVHGGSWQRGKKEDMRRVAERLAENGYTAVSIDYRLAPAYRYPAPLYDCKEAVRWMRRHAARYRIDPRRIGAFGYSAGAHLVALLATTDAADGLEGEGDEATPTRIQAAVAGGTPTDLRAFADNRTFESFLGGTAAELPDLYARASPITFAGAGDPPMFFYHGRHDWIVDVSQARAMVDVLRAAGVPVEYHEATLGHAVTFLFDDEQVGLAIAFFDRWLGAASP
jgi:acetyl esterase/lipase